MANEGPLIATSVRSRVVEDLAEAVGRGSEVPVSIRAGIDAEVWAAARARGRLASLLIRLRGLLFPVLVDLGPRTARQLVIATTNPFWLPAAVVLRRPCARLVTLVYDVYPESLEVRISLPAPVRASLRAVTRFGLRRSAGIVVLGDRTRRFLIDVYGLTCPVAVIPPGCGPLAEVGEPPRSLAHLGASVADRVVLSYVGNLGSVHDGQTLAAAIGHLLDSEPGRCAVLLSVRGDRSEDLLGPLRGRPEVIVLDRLEPDEWAWVTRRTDIALASLAADAGLVSLPSKVFASLAGGSAFLAVAPAESDLADLVNGLDVGLVAEPEDLVGTTEALTVLVSDDRRRTEFARRALRAAERFTPAAQAEQWARLLDEAGRSSSDLDPPSRLG